MAQQIINISICPEDKNNVEFMYTISFSAQFIIP